MLAFTLDHAEAKVLIVDREFSAVIKEALSLAVAKPLVISYDDPVYEGPGEIAKRERLRRVARLWRAGPRLSSLADEWDAISLNYTSGTTGDPKGVVYHHRGAYLLATGNVLTGDMGRHPVLSVDAADVPLQRLVFPLVPVGRGGYAMSACGKCAPELIYELMARHGVTHLCGAPIVHVDLARRRAGGKSGR